MSVVYSVRMSAPLRRATLLMFGLLWASGCYWLVLHWFFAQPGAFGSIPHPWEPVVLRIHGWMAVGSIFLLGWISAQHVLERWPLMVKRLSGVLMAAVAALLALSGYALYYTTDRVHDRAAVIHEIVGAAAVIVALFHWRRYRGRRWGGINGARGAASDPQRNAMD